MAHKIPLNIPIKGRVKKFSFPKINGRFGFSLFVGEKEVFIGVLLSDVVLEQIIKRRIVKISPAKTRTFSFDPLGGQEGNTEG